MTKPKLNPCKALVIVDGDVECYHDANKQKCPKAVYYGCGKPGIPSVKCLFLGK